MNCSVSREEEVEGRGGEGIVIPGELNSLIFNGRTNKEYHASTISQKGTTFVLYLAIRYFDVNIECVSFVLILASRPNRFKILLKALIRA